MGHAGSTGLGIVAFLLAILGLGEYYGYISSVTLGGLTPPAFGLLVVVAAAAAIGVFYAEGN